MRKRQEIQKMPRTGNSRQSLKEGVDKLIDFYEITESLKKFNAILNEVGGSL